MLTRLTFGLLLALTVLQPGTASAPRAQAPAIRVLLLGTGGGPNSNSERAGPSALIEAGAERLMVDVGRGVVSQLRQAGLTPGVVTKLDGDPDRRRRDRATDQAPGCVRASGM